MIKLMTKCRFFPLNMNGFFYLKVMEAWSRMLKHSLEHKVRQCSEFCKCLTLNPLRVPFGTQSHNFVYIWQISMKFAMKIVLRRSSHWSHKIVTPSYQRLGWPPPQVFSFLFGMQMECKTCFTWSYTLRAAK